MQRPEYTDAEFEVVESTTHRVEADPLAARITGYITGAVLLVIAAVAYPLLFALFHRLLFGS